MLKAKLILDKDFVIDQIDPRLFSSFLEHLGRAIYSGIYEPGHPTADQQGFRKDVLELVKELNVPLVRYPGGNFVSGYRWEDGVGPRDKRPTRLDLAWKSTDTNQVGTNEFMDWCKLAGTEPMLAVNLGTRGVQEAMDLIEYCNHPGGTYLSDLRKSHGYAQPHNVKYWCLGNEMDGPWQIGHKKAGEYGRLAAETAKVLKWVDPSVQLITCGSAGHAMTTFGAWETEVLEHTFEHTDFLSLHMYHGNVLDDMTHYLPLSDDMDDFIKEAVALCDAVAAKKKSRKKIMLSFDEWNIWYHDQESLNWVTCKETTLQAKHWSCGVPLLEDQYNFADVLLFGSMMMTLMNNCDRVKMACVAQLVNVIAPIMTRKNGPAWRQTLFYPFLHGSKYGRGTCLRPVLDTPKFDTKHRQGNPYLVISPVYHPDKEEVVIFAVNRSTESKLLMEVDLRSFGGDVSVKEWITMSESDLKKKNTFENPDAVVPRSASGAICSGKKLEAALEPLSWNVLRLSVG